MSRTTTVCLLTDECIHAVTCERRGRGWEAVARSQQELRLPDSLLVSHNPDELADAIAHAVNESHTSPSSITLVLPLQWCFTHVLARPKKRVTAEALAYEFEQYLPLPLENLTCAFVPSGNGNMVGVGIPTTPMAELIAALSKRNIYVEHITVDAITAAHALDSVNGSSSVMILDARWGRMVTGIKDPGRTVTAAFGLSECDNLAAAVAQQLQHRALSDGGIPPRWSVLCLADTMSESALEPVLNNGEERPCYFSPAEAVDTVALAAASVPQALDLRTGPLAGEGRWSQVTRLASQCMLCVLALLLVLTGGVHIHKQSLDQQFTTVNTAQREIYREVFRTDTLPPGAALRVASERIRLEGLTSVRGTVATQSTEPTLQPLATLRDIVAGLPTDVRVMLLDVRLDDKQLTIRGQTLKHRDAERIVETINNLPELVAHPPRTTRLRTGGVEFSVIATGVRSNGQTSHTGS